jgi:phosphate transport system substrate-binding protein
MKINCPSKGLPRLRKTASQCNAASLECTAFRPRWKTLGLPSGWMILLFGLIFVGCSDKSQPTSVANSSSGKVTIKGSNTIGEELAPRLIAEYKKDHPGAEFDLQSKGTGSGLWALVGGQCDIAAASRLANNEELQQAQTRGIELTNYAIGSYSVAVVVNSSCPVADLKREQVRDIFTGAIQNWKDVGGPDGEIHLYIRDPVSGTYLGFRELAMEDKPYATNRATMSTNYPAIVQAVSQDPHGIGYCSFDLTTTAGVKPVSIGGVAPTSATVNEGKYPYARMLRLYTNKAKEPSSAKGFIEFVQSTKGQEVLAQTGNVPRK